MCWEGGQGSGRGRVKTDARAVENSMTRALWCQRPGQKRSVMLSRCLLILRVKRRSRRSGAVRPDHPEKSGPDLMASQLLCPAAIAPSWWGTVDHAAALPGVALSGPG